MMAEMIATRATKPTVNPTAAPVLNPFPLLFFSEIGARFCEFGGTVGVTVTVRTSPVVVNTDTTGVGVQVEDDDVVSLVEEEEVEEVGLDVGLGVSVELYLNC